MINWGLSYGYKLVNNLSRTILYNFHQCQKSLLWNLTSIHEERKLINHQENKIKHFSSQHPVKNSTTVGIVHSEA